MYLLGGALALWASLGIDHVFRETRAGYAHCAAHHAAAGCRRLLAQGAPLRPASVWIFAAAGIALLGCAAAAALLALRCQARTPGRRSQRSVVAVLRELKPVA